MRRLQFGIAATQSLGLPQAAERRCRGLGAFFWLLGSAGSGNTYSLWDHQNRADPGLGLVGKPEAIEDYRMLRHVADNVAVAGHLGTGKAIIVGHDWGAPISWTSALLRPDLFDAVALLSVPYRPPSARRPDRK